VVLTRGSSAASHHAFVAPIDIPNAPEIKQRGVDPWFYTDAEWIDGDGLKCRALSWIAWKLRAGSWTLWELDFNSLRA
jgi:hypothetical protein